MDEIKNSMVQSEMAKKADGRFDAKIGNTNYHVTIFFDHDKGFTAKERLERLIVGEIRKSA